MASTYSTSLKLELIGNGDQSGTWGTTTNTNLGTLLEQAITGVQAITMVNADYTLTDFNGASDEARNAVLVLGGTNSAIRNVIAPAVNKLYVIKNATVGGYAVRIKTSTSTGVSIPSGSTLSVYCDGTEFYLSTAPYDTTNVPNTLAYRDASGNFAAGTITAALVGNVTGNVSGNAGTVTTNANLTGAVTSVGNATSLGSFTSANLASALTDETGTGAAVFANSPTLITPALGTPSALVGTNITGTAAGLSIGGNATTATTATVANNALGYNQTWQDVSGSRSAGTTYTNSTGRPIFISVRMEQDDGTLSLTVDGLLIGKTGFTAGPVNYTLTAVVPAGSTYSITSTGGTLYWYELR